MLSLSLLDWALVLLVTIGLAAIITIVVERIQANYARRQFLIPNQQGQAKSKTPSLLASFTVVSSDAIKKKFIRAGFYEFKYAHLYLPAKALLLLIVGVLLWLFGHELLAVNFLIFMVALISIIIVPDIYLEKKASNLVYKVSSNLAYLIDLMAICVQTGMTIESSIAYLSKEIAGFNDDLSYLLQITMQRAKVVGLEIALEELNERIDSQEMRSFTNTLTQSLKFGTSIYEVLVSLSQDIRDIQMLNLEEKVGTLSAKMSVPLILFIMFPIIILIVVPGILRVMGNG